MTLIKSISGMRGTIGGRAGENLTPEDIVSFTAAFGTAMKNRGANPKVVIGRDGRISGPIVSNLVSSTLLSLGIDVINLGLTTTPTVEMAVPMEEAGGGIIITASHNPKQWNALKFLNEKGEFISAEDGAELLKIVEEGDIEYAQVDDLGTYSESDYLEKHIDAILDLPRVEVDAIKKRGFKIVVDGINSGGAIAVPALLERLGCECILLNGEPNGQFAHNPEPLAENLRDLSSTVQSERADLGIVVDPDVDRLAFVTEDGEMFGEEYTIVAIADYLLEEEKGALVSNLSSSRALRDIAKKHGVEYYASAVGEVNVVTKMKEKQALFGGEGNGGVIYPPLHYGRDALVGIALFLTHLAKFGERISYLRKQYPTYAMAKNKIQLTPEIELDKIFTKLKSKYKNEELNTIDGLKIDLDTGWIHLRKSNTEPIIRIYTEGQSETAAANLAAKAQEDIREAMR